jgi:hypothetical protein
MLGLLTHVWPGVLAAQPNAVGERPAAASTAPGDEQLAPAPELPAPAPEQPAPIAEGLEPDGGIPDGTAPRKPVPPAFPPAIPNIDYGGRLRVGTALQDDDGLDPYMTVDADVYMLGQVHRMFKWQIALTLSYGGSPGSPSTTTWSVLDAIARFEPTPWFNIYAGRLIVVVDRFGQAGPWGTDEWFYPGIFAGAPLATPKTGPAGRDVGVNVWGAPFGGHLKYYLGAYQLQDPALNPLLSARLQLSLLNPEPAFYHRNTYYGDAELISAGIGAQFQKDGSRQPTPAAPPAGFVPLTDDHAVLSADLAIEKTLGGAGSLSVNGAAYFFEGDFRSWESLYLASLGFVFSPVVGIGKFRPSVRVQQAQAPAAGAGVSRVIDGQLSYLIMNWYARLLLNYRHSSIDLGTGAVKDDRLVLGVVLWDP